jgi:hypothetical protein
MKMKLPPLLVSLGSLVAAYALTTLWLNLRGVSPPAPGVAAGSSSPSRPGVHASSTQTVLTAVQRLLRSGDVEGAREALRPLADSDPAGFFALLRKLPYFPGLDDLINQAAAGLAWNDPETLSLLNHVGPLNWRHSAWLAYVAANVGKVPDQQVLDVSAQACFPGDTADLLGPLFRDAADKRPREFATLCTGQGWADGLEPFCAALMKAHPEQFQEIWSIVSPKLSASYRSTFVEHLVLNSHNAAALPQMIQALGDAGTHCSEMTATLGSIGYFATPPGDRAEVLEAIANQPPAARNAMLSSILSPVPEPASTADLGQMLGDMTSYPVQLESLRRWMQSQPGLDPSDRAWIDQLPTEKLKAAANRLLDEKKPR